MRSRVPPSMRLVPVAAMLLPVLLSGVDARAATGPADAGIELRCLPLQYREGAVAYRECLADTDAAPETLPFDDRHAIGRACAGDDGDCVATQLAALERAPSPALDALDAADRRAVRRQCAAAPLEDGAADYRRCLSDAVAALGALPPPDLGALTLPERATLELDCAAERDTAAGYRRCLLDALGVDVGETGLDTEAATIDGASPGRAADNTADATAPTEPPLPEPLANEPIALAPAPTDAPEPPAAEPSIDGPRNAPDVGAAEPLASPPGDAADDPDPAADADIGDIDPAADDARARMLATIDSLDNAERVVLATAVALPLLLLAFWSISRGARAPRTAPRTAPPAFDEPIRNAALAGRVAPSMRDGDEDFLNDIDADDTLADGLERDRAAFVAFDDGDHPFDDDSEPRAAAPVTDGSRADGVSAEGSDEGPDEAADDERLDEDAGAGFTPRSSFGRRLLGGRTALERGYAIEFLIYWMAYGDERYEPEARAALLAGGDDGDTHALIKRHVLEEDTDAFADVVGWLQSRCGELERVQVVDLLMALLVGERAMTPAQNTLLHFLADVFGLGAETLSRRHEEAFGRPMPPLARVDLAAWWERVEPERTLRWDARSVAALDEPAQDRVRLGLPPDGELDETAIVETFRYAARRCQPHRFDALGERERALVERQFVKYEAARDRLLGVETVGADT